ncbi:KAZD1 protein, partial [Amia calva]|nr:KAZD1 protein [Amia calva]
MPCCSAFIIVVVLCICQRGSFPRGKADDNDQDYPVAFYSKDEKDAGDAARCAPCSPELCSDAQGCAAGLVLDSCGCCFDCGNVEGQLCDLDSVSSFYGLCGRDLECRVDLSDLSHGEIPEPRCVCVSQDAVCGSDGQTYENICQFQEAASSSKGLRVDSKGPCQTVPHIKLPPQNATNTLGSSIIFLCEIAAFPMAQVQWRKDGDDIILPGDDPHISVQSRGGPLKFELSSWLQIEGVAPGDAGDYHCVANNELGTVSASASLRLLVQGK